MTSWGPVLNHNVSKIVLYQNILERGCGVIKMQDTVCYIVFHVPESNYSGN